MEKEIEDYLMHMTNLLNGQLRGAINQKARDQNKGFIMLTVGAVFEKAYNLGVQVKESNEALDKLKTDLGIEDEKRKDTT